LSKDHLLGPPIVGRQRHQPIIVWPYWRRNTLSVITHDQLGNQPGNNYLLTVIHNLDVSGRSRRDHLLKMQDGSRISLKYRRGPIRLLGSFEQPPEFYSSSSTHSLRLPLYTTKP
jgi:hypothetical protein